MFSFFFLFGKLVKLGVFSYALPNLFNFHHGTLVVFCGETLKEKAQQGDMSMWAMETNCRDTGAGTWRELGVLPSERQGTKQQYWGVVDVLCLIPWNWWELSQRKGPTGAWKLNLALLTQKYILLFQPSGICYPVICQWGNTCTCFTDVTKVTQTPPGHRMVLAGTLSFMTLSCDLCLWHLSDHTQVKLCLIKREVMVSE